MRTRQLINPTHPNTSVFGFPGAVREAKILEIGVWGVFMGWSWSSSRVWGSGVSDVERPEMNLFFIGYSQNTFGLLRASQSPMGDADWVGHGT